MSGPAQTCGDCVHFSDHDSLSGRCHAHPPVVVALGALQGRDGDLGSRPSEARTEWPRVKPTDWCGEWEAEE